MGVDNLSYNTLPIQISRSPNLQIVPEIEMDMAMACFGFVDEMGLTRSHDIPWPVLRWKHAVLGVWLDRDFVAVAVVGVGVAVVVAVAVGRWRYKCRLVSQLPIPLQPLHRFRNEIIHGGKPCVLRCLAWRCFKNSKSKSDTVMSEFSEGRLERSDVPV
jgi:hypothetical protein